MALPGNIYNLVHIVNNYFIARREGPLYPFVKPSHVQIFGFFTRHEYSTPFPELFSAHPLLGGEKPWERG